MTEKYRSTRHALLATAIFVMCGGAWSAAAVTLQHQQETETLSDFSRKVEDLGHSIQRNSDDIALIRRDEINYQIERDLLKETYSSKIASTGLIISAVSMAVGLIFALLGYLGLKSIGKVKDDYTDELQNVRELRVNLEIEIESLRKKQEKTERQVESLREIQEAKIRLLEITEKAGSVMNARNYDWALELIKVGLEINAEYSPLVRLFAICNTKLQRYPEAISAYKKLLLLDPGNTNDMLNYAELLVLSKDFEDYEEFCNGCKNIIDETFNGALSIFLNTIVALQKGDLAGAKNAMKPILDSCPDGLSQKMPGWNFDDTVIEISKMPPGELRDYANKVLGFFSGAISTEAMTAD